MCLGVLVGKGKGEGGEKREAGKGERGKGKLTVRLHTCRE